MRLGISINLARLEECSISGLVLVGSVNELARLLGLFPFFPVLLHHGHVVEPEEGEKDNVADGFNPDLRVTVMNLAWALDVIVIVRLL